MIFFCTRLFLRNSVGIIYKNLHVESKISIGCIVTVVGYDGFRVHNNATES